MNFKWKRTKGINISFYISYVLNFFAVSMCCDSFYEGRGKWLFSLECSLWAWLSCVRVERGPPLMWYNIHCWRKAQEDRESLWRWRSCLKVGWFWLFRFWLPKAEAILLKFLCWALGHLRAAQFAFIKLFSFLKNKNSFRIVIA